MSSQTSRFARAAKKAKRLYKTGRYKTFADAMRSALKGGGSKKRKSRKVGKVKKTRASRKVVRRSSVASGSSLQSHKSSYRQALSERLKTYLFLKDRAGTKRLKRHYGKVIANIKRQLKNLS